MLLFAAMLMVSAYLFEKVHYARQIQEMTRQLQAEADSVAARLEYEMNRRIALSRSLGVILSVNTKLTPEEFSDIAQRLKGDATDIVNIAAAPDLKVSHVHPLEPNRMVLGLDYRRHVQQLPAIRRAMNLGRSIVAGPLTLLQGNQGFLIRTPVFSDAARQRGSFWGLVSVVMDRDAFFDNALPPGPLRDRVSVRRMQDARDVVYGEPGLFQTRVATQSFDLQLQQWQVGVRPLGGWPVRSENFTKIWQSHLLIGLILFAVMFALRSLKRDKQVAEQYLMTAIEALDDGFALYDPEGRFVMCNSRYREMYPRNSHMFQKGISFDYIIREGVRLGTYPEAKGREKEWIAERLAAFHEANTEMVQKTPEGGWLKVAERRTPDGSIVAFRVDITELKNARDTAVEASRAKSEFLNVISHELRTPLTVMMGYNAFLKNLGFLRSHAALTAAIRDAEAEPQALRAAMSDFEAEISKFTGLIDKSGQHLINLINELLDVAKIEAGEMKLNRTVVEADDVVDEVARLFKGVAADKGIEMKSAASGTFVSADPKRLRQILINLVGNAVKFTEAGEISVNVAPKGRFVRFDVTDSGCGIDEEGRRKVFDRFQQLDTSDTRKVGGTGLGLAICKHLVEMHGGRIGVDSKPGEGSTFWFTLPSALVAQQPATAPGAAAPVPEQTRKIA